jgi:general secretion pathway protein B
MSYILEALKKAQAERQLGNAPTLHAPTLQSMERSAAGGRLKKPLLLVIVAMAVAIAALVAMVLRPAAVPAPAPVAQAVVDAPAQSAPVAPAVPAAAQSSAPVVADNPAPLPAPVAALPPPVATLTPAVRRQAGSQAAPAAPTPAAGDLAVPAVNAATAATTATGAAGSQAKAPAFEEPVQNLRDLPEPIQRSIPQVAVGGYIYSKNPADRLLLIDKVLRREGDEVAPGLKLEKLLPKEAVFNFKGYRYRVPY